MDAEFWHKKWADKDIAFHTSGANPMLERYFSALALSKGARIFLPLCGKTRDIAWLRQQGMHVAGAELSRIAVEELFSELGETPVISELGELSVYTAPGLDIYLGDIFALTAPLLGAVDAIYDRAALVALPAEMRENYTQHLIQMTDAAPQLLVNYDYQQSAMPGPPFAISDDELNRHYAQRYTLESLHCESVPGGLKGQCPAQEKVWLLTP